jgi:hypothetical protein
MKNIQTESLENFGPNTSLKMKLIDDEMRDMLMLSKDTSNAIREMNEAFAGDIDV